MGKCTKCGANFVGTPENPPKDGLCRYCEITELKAKCERLEGEVAACEKAIGHKSIDSKPVHETILEHVAQCAEMRSVLKDITLVEWSDENAYDYWFQMHELAVQALSTTAGTAILARLEEARRLLEDYNKPETIIEQWFARRDQWLEGGQP